MKNYGVILLIFLFISSSYADSISAELDRDSVGLGEAFNLTITIPHTNQQRPDLSALQQDFEILNTSTSSQMTIINGKYSANTMLHLTLRAKKEGKLLIPSIKIGKDNTPLLTIEVTKAPKANTAQENSNIWVEMTTDLEKNQVFIQQGIPITIRIYFADPLWEANLNPPVADNALIESLGQGKESRKRMNGKMYQMYEQQFAIFPESTGELTIQGAVLQAKTVDKSKPNMFNDPFFNDPFFGGSQFTASKPITLSSNNLTIDVKPIPDQAKGKTWLPAKKVTLSDSWQNNPPELITGEPVSLTIKIEADNVTATQIPSLSFPDLPDWRIYSEPPQQETHNQSNKIAATSTQTFTLIPEKEGKITLPAISLHWWNINTNTLELAEIPVRTFEVKKGNNSTPITTTSPNNTIINTPQTPITTQPQNNTPTLLIWLVIVLIVIIVLLIIIMIYWRIADNKRSSTPASEPIPNSTNMDSIDTTTAIPEKQAQQACLQACRNNDARLAARLLIQWTQLAWPDNPPTSLLDIAEQIEQGEHIIRNLHQHLYQSSTETWQGWELAALLKQGLKHKNAKNNKKKEDLPPLYPNS